MVCKCQENLRLRRWTGEPWAIGQFIRMERRCGKKMINHSTKTERSKILPLRWIGNICGEFAGNHIVKCVNMDEDEEYGFLYKYHAFMWKCLNKPYEWWGTYYTIDMKSWKEELDKIKIDMSDSGWDDYDEFGKAYWEDKE
jgi:hypothetical protein